MTNDEIKAEEVLARKVAEMVEISARRDHTNRTLGMLEKLVCQGQLEVPLYLLNDVLSMWAGLSPMRSASDITTHRDVCCDKVLLTLDNQHVRYDLFRQHAGEGSETYDVMRVLNDLHRGGEGGGDAGTSGQDGDDDLGHGGP